MSARLRAQSGRYSHRVAEIARPRYRASFTVYVDASNGGAWCVGVECTHEHADHAAAETCAERIARHVERRETLPAYAVETVPGELARCLADAATAARD